MRTLRKPNSIYSVADVGYLRNALQHFMNRRGNTTGDHRIVFVVCSDDIGWSKAAFDSLRQFRNVTGLSGADKFVYSEKGEAGFDLRILSRCDSMIITSGSFGWWAAWLANGTTVYYKNFPKSGSVSALNFIKGDYYPPQWIPME